MPIRQYLGGHRFDPETTRLMGIALETACQALRSQGVDDPSREALATAIIGLPEPANAIPTGDRRGRRGVSLNLHQRSNPPPILGPACAEVCSATRAFGARCATPRLPCAAAPLGVAARS